MSDHRFQRCINHACQATYDVHEVLFACPACGDLLDVQYDWDRVEVPSSLNWFEGRWTRRVGTLDYSGVWRFRELLPFCDEEYCVTIGEGQTLLECNDGVAGYVGMNPGRVFLQYEGLNPSGSFKDNGMAAAFSHARLTGAKHVACASTGNTSAAVALYAHACGMKCTVFIGSGRIAYGKLSQALDYGAQTIQIQGNFDDCMRRVKQICGDRKLYLVNSLNPFRLEGQKAIMYRILEGLQWHTPDWIVAPGGNLGNSSAFGKAFAELAHLGLIDHIPRMAVINAAGANTLYDLYERRGIRFHNGQVDEAAINNYYNDLNARGYRPETVATAIEISRPVNLKKCLRSMEICNGIVREVPDEAIVEAKSVVGRYGLGCEPASGASIAGLRLLRQEDVIGPDETVACILTGHQLKDPAVTVKYHTQDEGAFSNQPIEVADDLDAVIAALGLAKS
ncbi:MAG: threonine synthase [Sedimentisphaerales bacterium]|nr:threonine synthase [Sedimentisphaerales bacterium]